MDAFYNMGIFVMDPMGQIFVYQQSTRMGEFHHSSLVAGLAVASAGEMEVENGILLEMTDRSGHYQPRQKHSAQVRERLKEMGADLSSVNIDLNAPF